jgi:hypothetical protein
MGGSGEIQMYLRAVHVQVLDLEYELVGLAAHEILPLIVIVGIARVLRFSAEKLHGPEVHSDIRVTCTENELRLRQPTHAVK